MLPNDVFYYLQLRNQAIRAWTIIMISEWDEPSCYQTSAFSSHKMEKCTTLQLAFDPGPMHYDTYHPPTKIP